ncbi:MAG: hypothetical protein ACXW00_06450 [Methylobacter sp.]
MATKSKSSVLLPRFIRYRDAPAYLGMDRNRFNGEVRPFITAIPIGKQGIAFDRLDLDAWADDYIERNGRPSDQASGGTLWDASERQDYGNAVNTGTLKNKSKELADFSKALARTASKKRNGI